MSEQVFRLPDLGEGLTEAEIIEWQVAVGDTVEIDQHVVVVETAKATVEVPCPYAGRVLTLHGDTGALLEVGTPLITIASDAPAVAVAGPGRSDAGSHAAGVPAVTGTPAAGGEEPLAGHEQYRQEELAGARSAGGVGADGTTGDGDGAPGDGDGASGESGSGAVLIGYGTGAPRARRRRVRPSGADTRPATRVDHRDGSMRGSGRPGDRDLTLIDDIDQGVDGAARAGAPGPEPTTPGPASREPAARLAAVRVISPIVRRLAAEHGVDLDAVPGSGPAGVVRRKDVEDAIAASGAGSAGSGPGAPEHSVGAVEAGSRARVGGTERHGGETRVPLRGIRRTIADKLTRSRREIPDATTWVDVDATGLMQVKDEIRAVHPDAGIGVLALMARICLAGLARFPELNASVDLEREEIVQHGRVSLGFAAQSPRGLVVPVVHDASSMTTTELARALRDLTAAAREGRLGTAELTGGTFTLNNYGVFGVDGSTPILNHPEAAMVGVGRIIDKPWAHEGQLALRKVTQLSLTFDHRVCDGGTAGGFLRHVADCVERPSVMLAEL